MTGHSDSETGDSLIPVKRWADRFFPDSELKHARGEDMEEHVAAVVGGNLVLDAEMRRWLGLGEDGSLTFVRRGDQVEVRPNVHSLRKLYIEPTTGCNLSCKTCVRSTWNEPIGQMSRDVFDLLVGQLGSTGSVESVMFGGFGEPLLHPDIAHMVREIKALGLKVELVTNGMLLNEKMARSLIDAGLDTLWVSFDGVCEESFEDIRVGATFVSVLENVRRLQEIQCESEPKIKVAVAFVLMRRNAVDLAHVGELARGIGAEEVSVSTLIPYSRDMVDEMVYACYVPRDSVYQLKNYTDEDRRSYIPVDLPVMTMDDGMRELMAAMLGGYRNLSVAGSAIWPASPRCRFVDERCTFVRWDGAVCPCMGLLHTYRTYLNTLPTERTVTAYPIGDVTNADLSEIWDLKEYRDFRDRVARFDFGPCLQCGPCVLVEGNDQDCMGNDFPTCGACLWAQGAVRCP